MASEIPGFRYRADRRAAGHGSWRAAAASAAATRAEVDRLEAEGVALMRDNGMEVITEIDRAPFQALAAEAAWPVYTDRFGSELIERIVAFE